MSNIFYAETDGAKYSTNQSGAWNRISPSLFFELPAKTATDDTALIILNVPMPYAEGGNVSPGGTFAITVDGHAHGPYASFTADSPRPATAGRKPLTLVISYLLDANQHLVEGCWQNANGSTVVIDTKASLSATTGLLG